MSVKDALEMAKKNKVEIVDFKFIDVPGLWQHFSIPATDFDAEKFEQGLGFDGSSIRGFQSINESDMILMPDPDTAMMDPFTEHPTLSFVCNVLDAITREPYSRDPRYITQKAEKYLKSTGMADISYWGPEIEFFIFDSIRFDQNHHEGYYHIDSGEGFWNSGNGDGPNLGNKIRYKEGYFPVPPMDQYQDLRSEMVLNLEKCGIKIEVHHHEVATGGQTEIDMRFDTMTKMADKVLLYKYVVKNTARQRGKVVTCHAQAAVSGQRFRHALPPESVEGWKEYLLRQEGLRADQRHGQILYRRAAQARPCAVRLHRADDQFLSQTGSRLRSADQFSLLGEKPQRLRADSHVLDQREGQAAGVPDPRSQLPIRILPFRPC